MLSSFKGVWFLIIKANMLRLILQGVDSGDGLSLAWLDAFPTHASAVNSAPAEFGYVDAIVAPKKKYMNRACDLERAVLVDA